MSESPSVDLELTEVNDTPWLSREQQEVWRSFLGGSTVLMDQLDRDLRREHGLSMSEYEILVRLSEAPARSIRMAELAALVAHSRSRITHTIARLEKAGIVGRDQCSTDGRGVTATLTDHGFAVLANAAHTHVRGVHTYLLDNSTPDEFAALGRIMERISAQLGGRTF
ncbi:MarR family transcriptional regulator [Aeromicrobium sp. PE09-221]|uniref:MarR family winged helix-turn-helix transcriptional regulator n=1 Tax=Aeromicrobium sp. PE09-221 TaxID=1898043 RepID=UPI000B3E9737|nr:MarR family transcriptional regulator [Aeromicrobium sp. PE09-221]OUZ11654.1 MarR family transcriptional regulator [Aeromicrobium sp. PE09-221]